jgi:Mg-chelatase subunit ChlD
LRAGYADFVLVMDVSTSMLRETSSGAIKQDVVIQAARDFVRLLSLDPDQQTGGSDQLAVVWFNDNTGQEQALTNNRAALTAAIDRLPGRTAQGTRLDKAFLAGAAAFASPTRQNSNQPVIILLTDGLPNRVPIPPGGTQEDTVLAAADKAKALGIQIFTIGVGDPDAPDIVDRVNPELLAACASDPSMSFIAPEPEDLAEIYQQIASTFCASGGGTPRPYRIYIPVYYWTNDPLPKPTLCPRSSYADFVLVMDVSTSMLRKTAAGNIKRDVVLAAAKDFVSLLSLDPEPGSGRSDQLAVVWFNDATGVEQGLTSNRPALRDAVNRLPGRTGQGTRLDLAFQAGAAALKSPLRRAENQPVMIVLTDGLPNRVPAPPGGTQEDTVIAAAAAAKAEGIMVFTIGVGRPDAPDLVDRVNPALLAACASQPEMSFIAPEAEDLAKIYGQIVKVFCTSSKIMRPFRTAGPRWFGKMEPVRSE